MAGLNVGSFSEQSFICGTPEQLIQATGSPKIYATWPHGDETLGPRLGYEIYTQQPDLLTHVDYTCGNPLAASFAESDSPRRYTEGGTDLNRSFNPKIEPKSYEEQRAQEILAQIKAGSYDYVLDLHTSTTEVGGCALVSEAFVEETAVRKMIAASPIGRIVVLPEFIAKDGLIGNVPNSMSVEYSRPHSNLTGVEDMILTIRGLVLGKPMVQAAEREFYYVSGPISKTEDPGPDARNFVRCDQGYYPVLIGEKAYRDDPTKGYLGFAATRKEVVIL